MNHDRASDPAPARGKPHLRRVSAEDAGPHFVTPLGFGACDAVSGSTARASERIASAVTLHPV